VDTGAQVTVISAAVAERAGIYHLMDRRYAGRATGEGHCVVLGRIQARHVYFFLGGNEEQKIFIPGGMFEGVEVAAATTIKTIAVASHGTNGWTSLNRS
jgi:Aspartyl protease